MGRKVTGGLGVRAALKGDQRPLVEGCSHLWQPYTTPPSCIPLIVPPVLLYAQAKG